MRVLVLNAGSSSQKSRLYELGEALPTEPPAPLWNAQVDWSERPGTAELTIQTAAGEAKQQRPADNRRDLIAALLASLWSGPHPVVAGPEAIDVVGHRVVHGGPEFQQSVRVTPEVKAAIARNGAFAPEHNPAALEGIEVAGRLLGPRVPQVAVFDTAFHAHLPPAAAVYPGPYAWVEQGIRRYGFHGISHQYCAERAARILGRDLAGLRLITCHLGNGCSLAAIRDGRSIDTTMGLTPLEGLMMGSRSGTVDPGILIYLMRQHSETADRLDDTLNHDSGLKGISGVGGDMRQVLAARDAGNARAALAIDMYVHRLCSFIGAMLATLGGVDALVFAGGVGEHAAEIRARACAAFVFLGLRLDEALNAPSPADRDVAAPDSTVRVLIVKTQEDWMIARDCWRLART
jgi:acetate kinase